MKVMRTTVATVVAATLSMSAFSVFAEASLTGAGATFPAPVYAKWADTYQKETGNKVNYQGIGSYFSFCFFGCGAVPQLFLLPPAAHHPFCLRRHTFCQQLEKWTAGGK